MAPNLAIIEQEARAVVRILVGYNSLFEKNAMMRLPEKLIKFFFAILNWFFEIGSKLKA